jgi:hypothetical protein
VWQSVVNGQTLKFHLAGINNQNFIMRDEETGSWWQQISGEAIQGPLKGEKLVPVDYDEVSYGIWKKEHPDGRVLRPDARIAAENKYESADWENQVGKMPVRVDAKLDDALSPRTLVVGVAVNGAAKAYPFAAIESQNPIVDTIGGNEILLLLGEDKRSVRAFDRTVDGRKLEFFISPETSVLMDAETGSTWDFTGRALSGELTGKQLTKVPSIKDYWFDWKTYHPETRLYTAGSR